MSPPRVSQQSGQTQPNLCRGAARHVCIQKCEVDAYEGSHKMAPQTPQRGLVREKGIDKQVSNARLTAFSINPSDLAIFRRQQKQETQRQKQQGQLSTFDNELRVVVAGKGLDEPSRERVRMLRSICGCVATCYNSGTVSEMFGADRRVGICPCL